MKLKTVFSCQSCGYQSLRWLGRCPNCNEWNSLLEERQDKEGINIKGSSSPQSISEIKGEAFSRSSTQIQEFDRILGGGVVPGSLVLIGGEPGVGKSTLLLDIAAKNNITRISGTVPTKFPNT